MTKDPVDHVHQTLSDASVALHDLLGNRPAQEAIAGAGQLLSTALAAGRRVYSCGNGGSMCDAMHFAEELSGRFRLDRPALAATAISDPGHLSCVANDYGYEQVFSRYIEAHGQEGDCLLAISTSGSSKNVVRAAQVARARGLSVIALTGAPASVLADHSDLVVCTPGGRFADRVQELHIKVIHILIELVEAGVFQSTTPGMANPGRAPSGGTAGQPNSSS
ncbi:SIS domain-containing protein [Ramlibacter sp. MMS24-I3-19]|uniref:SIS domain-containing protein n=1 Tax=Ramlibacter sp. MMS24-I3-19 TaxID=3416606 RepID=UPI003D02D284